MFNQPVDSARELLARYSSGERVFKGASLNGVNLQGACLERVRNENLIKSIICGLGILPALNSRDGCSTLFNPHSLAE